MTALTEITLNHYLVLSGMLFMLGAVGVMIRRNIIVIYMCLELMLNAANLALVSFSRFSAQPILEGHIMVFFIITVAAAEVAVGLALIVALYRLRQTTNVHDLNTLKF
jgi:NADH-quinone oxidoreductase subunit K